MSRAKRVPVFADEAALCAAFMETARKYGLTPYPETAGFDILLVADDGLQIGIQAKMRFNMEVLRQVLPSLHDASGPDYLAVLVPDSCGYRDVSNALGLTLFESHGNRNEFTPGFNSRYGRYDAVEWHYRSPAKRCPLPSYVPDVVAGSPSPIQLTQWKIGALEIAALLELRGYVTRIDFKYCGIDYRRWVTDSRWLMPGAVAGQFVIGPRYPSFAAQHPVVYPQVLAKTAERLAVPSSLVPA